MKAITLTIAGVVCIGSALLHPALPEAFANGNSLPGLARHYYDRKMYYSSITETLRYQHLHPRGNDMPGMILLRGKALFRGGNHSLASEAFQECASLFPEKPEGREALYCYGHLRLVSGSPFFACRTMLRYEHLYPSGESVELAVRDRCYALALMGEGENARAAIAHYRTLFPGGEHHDDLRRLESMINREEERPKKSLWISVIGSIFIPGFGHFYAGECEIGALAFCSNAALMYLFYDGLRDRDALRMTVFGLSGLAFYQYQLFSAVSNVYSYNGGERYYRNVRMSITTHF